MTLSSQQLQTFASKPQQCETTTSGSRKDTIRSDCQTPSQVGHFGASNIKNMNLKAQRGFGYLSRRSPSYQRLTDTGPFSGVSPLQPSPVSPCRPHLGSWTGSTCVGSPEGWWHKKKHNLGKEMVNFCAATRDLLMLPFDPNTKTSDNIDLCISTTSLTLFLPHQCANSPYTNKQDNALI